MATSNALPSIAALPLAAEPHAPLVALDRAIAGGGAGLVLVQVSGDELAWAVARHACRRAAGAGRACVQAEGTGVESAFRDLAHRLGIPRLSHEAHLAARQIVQAAATRSAVVVAPIGRARVWDLEVARALSRELAPGERPVLVVVLHAAEVAGLEPATRVVELGSRLAPPELASWWEALAAEGASLGTVTDVRALEGWWTSARELRAPEPAPRTIADQANRLLARLSLAHRAWPVEHLEKLGARTALDELSRAGLVAVHRGYVSITREALAVAPEPTAEDAACAADALEHGFPVDPWAWARAAELWAEAGDPSRAGVAIEAALSSAEDPAARADFTAQWRAAIERLPREQWVDARLRAAETARARGDAEGAYEWAKAAAEAAPERHDAWLSLGRATLSRGDLVTAAAALDKAKSLARTAAERVRVGVDMAEIRYVAGALDDSERHAREALASAGDASARLGARNVLGKLLLARGAYSEAETHFAADEIEAGCAGDETAALRARLNRAIAVLSAGRGDEARPMLEHVLAEGEARSEMRAVAFALSNLAVLAISRHDYGDALRLSERAIEVRRRLGDKIGLARAIINLAELRLRLGLYAEAEQALVFGKQAMSPGMPASRITEIALVAAHVHLARSRTLEAARELSRAMSSAASASDGEKLSECHRLGARIALEDGDVTRARGEIERARELSRSGRSRAEVALLSAMQARAAGDDATELGRQALALCREADDEHLLREAHMLLCDLARAAGDIDAARSHLESAVALRDRIAEMLDPELRKTFLARRDLAPIAAAESAPLSRSGLVVEVEAPVSSRGRRPDAAPRAMVGEDPAMRGLQVAIRKIARSESTVLVHGESGTGKELVAEAIHAASARAAGPLVKVNCGALVETLLLSELFGHEKGSFTGASARRRGRFELAEGGTLFLDEIGDISARTQVALLRVLQERTFERVGGTTSIRADVRIVCATHRDLRAMVERGEFREDLYYRLRGVTLEVPALRARLGDLPLIADAILTRISSERREPKKSLAPEAFALLGRHRWPGNVRELENALRAAALFADGDQICAADLADNVEGLRTVATPSVLPPPPADLAHEEPGAMKDDEGDALPLAESGATEVVYAQVRTGGVSLSDLKRQIERDCIARALTETRGNITRAATLLGMKRPRLSQLVKQYGLAAVSEGS